MTRLATITATTNSTKTMNTLLSTASFFAGITDRFFASFESMKNTSKANEILYFFDNYAILKLSKFSLFNPVVSKVKTIEEIGQLLDKKAVLAYRKHWLENHKSRPSKQELFAKNEIEEQQETNAQDLYRGSSNKRQPRYKREMSYNCSSNRNSRQINQL